MIGFTADDRHVLFGGGAPFSLGAYGYLTSDDMLEVGLQALLEIRLGALAGQVEHIHVRTMFGEPILGRFAARRGSRPEVAKCAAGIGDPCLKNSIHVSWLNVPSMIILRALPWLVTLAIMDSFCRVPPMAMATGVRTRGA